MVKGDKGTGTFIVVGGPRTKAFPATQNHEMFFFLSRFSQCFVFSERTKAFPDVSGRPIIDFSHPGMMCTHDDLHVEGQLASDKRPRASCVQASRTSSCPYGQEGLSFPSGSRTPSQLAAAVRKKHKQNKARAGRRKKHLPAGNVFYLNQCFVFYERTKGFAAAVRTPNHIKSSRALS